MTTILRSAALPAILVALWASLACAQTYHVVVHLGSSGRPYGGLAQGLNGRLYSTSSGAGGAGDVFEVTTGGNLIDLHKLAGNSQAGLVLATDGNFYGTTFAGGSHRAGTIFKVRHSGKLSTLYTFCSDYPSCADGAEPSAPLIQARDGSFYGTTLVGGTPCSETNEYCGTIFKIDRTGRLTTLYTFCQQPACADGNGPAGALLQASDGNFYGTTTDGGTGASYGGTVFRLTPAGALTTLQSFCVQTGCPDGGNSAAGLVQASDGYLYGTNDCTIFRVGIDGSFATLYNFCSQPNDADGGYPSALIQATDGALYGTTSVGGGGQGLRHHLQHHSRRRSHHSV
jgi:uncharacterized repeat protein (TIGR03803 family)